MDAIVSKSNEDRTFLALLFAVLAGLALCLATASVYGVMAYMVEQRVREIGVRIALGASRPVVLRMILVKGLLLTAAGVAVGLAAAAGATQLLASVLFHVQPLDVHVYFAVIVILGLVTLLAAYVPARRASAVDPVRVLQAD